MNADLSDLYREVVIDHSRRPRHFHAMPDADGKAEGFNPFCGDRVTVYVKKGDGAIRDISFEGSGCAICTASASMMTQAARNRTAEEAIKLADWFQQLLTAKQPQDEPPDEQAQSLSALTGVRQFPIRIKCATLAWHALKAAITQSNATVTTEDDAA